MTLISGSNDVQVVIRVIIHDDFWTIFWNLGHSIHYMQSPAGFSEEKRVRALPLLQALESQICAVLLTVVLSRIKVAKIYPKH